MKTKIDFRTSKPQVVHLNVDGETRVEFLGVCPVTQTRLYTAINTGDDPRGPLGNHAAGWFVASEYDMTGPDVLVSWNLVMNERENYEKGLKFAKSNLTFRLVKRKKNISLIRAKNAGFAWVHNSELKNS
jgi:hypothetical protein